MNRIAVVVAFLAMALAGCSSSGSSGEGQNAPKTNRAVVLVTGGALVTPFTTPDQACQDGDGFLAAGNTYTALRSFLLSQGKQVYTAPAMSDWGPVKEPAPDSIGPFKDCPPQLPESLTVLTTGDLNAGGERLARFVTYLHDEFGVTDVDLVGHSNGGLWSRSAIKVLKDTNSPITVRSLTTLGTPHDGAIPPRFYAGEIPLSSCLGQAFCEERLQGWAELVQMLDKGLSAQDTVRYLSGADGWNSAQGSALDGIPVTLLAGTYFTASGGDPVLWPSDGTVARYSALASDVSDAVMPWRTCWEAPLLHWVGYSVELGVPWTQSITDNPDALARVNRAIDEADTALQGSTRQGC